MKKLTCVGCFLWSVLLAFVVWISATCVQYSVWVIFDKQIAMLPAAVIGLLGGELTIPVAIILAILKSCNVL